MSSCQGENGSIILVMKYHRVALIGFISVKREVGEWAAFRKANKSVHEFCDSNGAAKLGIFPGSFILGCGVIKE